MVFNIQNLIVLLVVVQFAASKVFYKGTPLENMVDEMRSNCDNGLDSMDCVKIKAINFLDSILKKDNYQLSSNVEVRSNGYVNEERTGRSGSVGQENGFLEIIEQYLKSHDIIFKLPLADAQVVVSQRHLNDDELNLNFKFPGSDSEGKGRKSKLKKIAIPIMVFVLLKAMTLIPLALGILGLKAWNSLQLGFLSFVVSVGLAIFQLCKKLAIDHHHPHIAAHGPWDGRSSSDKSYSEFDAQNLAYNAYA